MAFVQVQQSLIDHRKTFELADQLDMDRYAVVGRLVALWAWCLDNALTGCLGNVRPRVLAHIMGYDSPGQDPDRLLQALISSGFVEIGADGFCWIHDWGDHMGELIRRREEHADAQRRYRERVNAGKSQAAGASAFRTTNRGRE